MPQTLFIPLSERQRTVLNVVSEFLEQKRYPPTILEIQEGANLKNPGMAFKALHALQDKGYILRIKSKHRSVRLTDVGQEFIDGSRQLNLTI